MEDVQNACYQEQMVLFSEPGADFQCFDNTLSQDECADLYNVAIFGGVVEDKDILKNIHGPHKPAMKQLLENQAEELVSLRSSRQTPDQYRNSSSVRNHRGFDFNDFLQTLDVKVTFNQTALNYFLADFQQLQAQYEALRQQKAIEMRQLIQDKFVETEAKLRLEWINQVQPVIEAYEDYLVASV